MKMRRWSQALGERALCVSVVLAMVCSAMPVAAQGAGDEERSEAAQSMYRLAVAEFKAGNFRVALDKLLEVYELDPDPVILYNIARAYEEMGQLADAADYFQQAVADPNLPRELQAEVGRRLPQVMPALNMREARVIATNSVNVAVGQSADRAFEAFTLSEKQSDDGGDNTALIWGGGGATLLGFGLLAGAFLVDLSLGDPIEELKDPVTRADRQRTLDLQDQISSGQTTATIFYITGGVALATGATLLTLALLPESGDGDEGQGAEEGSAQRGWGMQVVPMVTEGGGGLWLGGQFE